MAGFFYIGDENGLSVGSHVFYRILELSKRHFEIDKKDCQENIFRSIEETGMDMLPLDIHDSRCFNAFYQALKRGLKEYVKSKNVSFDIDEFYSITVENTQELINKLERDTRLN